MGSHYREDRKRPCEEGSNTQPVLTVLPEYWIGEYEKMAKLTEDDYKVLRGSTLSGSSLRHSSW